MPIGILALQGGFREHEAALQRLSADVREVRKPEHLEGLHGLIIPGGESTTLGHLIAEYKLHGPLKSLSARIPIWGTCAGLILLARDTPGLIYPNLNVLNLTVRRNGYGRQVDSFRTDTSVPAIGSTPFPAIFIRAPVIDELGPEVKILSSLPSGSHKGSKRGTPIAVLQERILATTFHPELTQDDRFHRYFLTLVNGQVPDGS